MFLDIRIEENLKKKKIKKHNDKNLRVKTRRTSYVTPIILSKTKTHIIINYYYYISFVIIIFI